MSLLVACKNEEDPIKNEGATVVTTLFINFSDAQGQLISGSHQRRMPRFKSASKAPSFLFTFPKMSRSPK